MTDSPVSLRTALRDAMDAFEDEAWLLADSDGPMDDSALAAARARIAALIAQIPFDIEAPKGSTEAVE